MISGVSMYKYLIILIALLLSSCSANQAVPKVDKVPCDRWGIVEGKNGDMPVIIRFNQCDRVSLNADRYRILIRVTWAFEHNGYGMPSMEVSEQMAIFEERMIEALECTNDGVLVAVVTTGGYREWVYYVTEMPAFGAAITNMPQETDPYPVKIDASADSNWDYLNNEILAGINKS